MGSEAIIGYSDLSEHGRMLFKYTEPIHIDVPCKFVIQKTKTSNRFILLVKPDTTTDERQQEIRFS